jgi:hypothetical protein
MDKLLDGLPGSVKLAVISLTGLLVAFAGLKNGVINISGAPTPALTPTPTPTVIASLPIEMINVRLNLRDEDTKESIPNAKIELVYLSGPIVDYTDSIGFIDIKIPKTSTTKIFISKQGYMLLDRQLDPSLNIPQDRNIVLYLSPRKKEVSELPIPTITPTSGPVTAELPVPMRTNSETPEKLQDNGSSSITKSDKISSEEFMRSFYQKINDRKLNDAWLMLSEKRRNKQEKGFESFQDWWGDKVEKVNVKEINKIGENSGVEEIEVVTSYIINQKEVNEKPITFRVAMNSEKGHWEILARDE